MALNWWEQQKQGYTDFKELGRAQKALQVDFARSSISAKTYNESLRSLSTFTDGVGKSTTGMSKSINLANMSFQGVGEAVGNAVLKVGLWIAATTVVIGTVRKLGEVVQLWRDLEVTLERIGITTTTFGADLYKFFDLTADVAIRMGMPIEQTLKGMDLALRATASYEDQTRRSATATMMLRDAAILGNVAGMQFDQAIDILVGSLKQVGMELDQGIILLDKWVAVAKKGAVSVNDLSQGFAIMASAAASAGLNIDQVNGIITALSEAVTLGPIEVGNAIRALMATLYNPGSIATMGRFGIAVRDATGEFRSFWDIMNELSSMVVTGALDEKQILQIAKAAGAGQRRYAQFIALLKNWDSAVRASVVSAEAQGDALSANERIVDTLTNAWDQFTAAQNKFWYAFGDRSGMVEDMTTGFKRLAGVFSTIADINEPLAKTIKVIAMLVISLTALKIAMVLLAKTQLTGWAITQLSSLTRMRMLLGFGGGGMAALGLSGAGTTAAGQFRAPAGGWTQPGTQRQFPGGAFLPITTRQTQRLGRAGVAGAAWRGTGRMAIAPMRGFWLAGGAIAGGAIMRELYDSDWSMLGGGIGAGVGAFLMGPVGLIIGAFIGGGIAKLIEEATMSFEDRVATERERWTKDLPDSIRVALGKIKDIIDISSILVVPLEDLIKDQKDSWKEEIAARTKLFNDQAEELMQYQNQPFAPLTTWYLEPRVEGQRQGLEELLRAQIARQETDTIVTQASVYEEIAIEAKKIGEALGLQEAAEVRINELKSKSLDFTQEEFDLQMQLASSAPITHRRILAQLERYTPVLADMFREMFPSYKDFVVLDPEAYRPLVEALGTLTSMEQSIRDEQEKVNKAVAQMNPLVADVGDELENIVAHWKYWADLQESVISGTATLEQYYEAFNITVQDGVKAEEEAFAILSNIVNTFAEGKEGALGLTEAWDSFNTALSVTESRLQHVGDYLKPGRLEFVGPEMDIGEMQRLLDKYETMLKDYITSERQIFYAFTKDEGAIQGLLNVFPDVYPEVWQAMLSELAAIESNTSQMIEAEYNLPGDYVRPGRFWAMKTTQPTTFGPMQESLWQLWEEFLQRERGMQSGGTVNMPGAYYLHKNETVVPDGGLIATNTLLGNTYQILLISQQYLSQINLGISGVRQELSHLIRVVRESGRGMQATGETEFSKVAKTGYSGISSLGTSRR